MRLIDADALMIEPDRGMMNGVLFVGDRSGGKTLTMVQNALKKMINNAPTIDAEPVRHGRWIDMQEDDATEGMWRCSVCGSDSYFDILTPAEAGCYYCPNCGAKMDVEVQG